MSTHPHPHSPDERTDPSAQTLLVWVSVALLVVTGLIVLGSTVLGLTSGIVVAYGGLIIAAFAVFVFIMKFIGPEDH
jgi:hypothetical protein